MEKTPNFIVIFTTCCIFTVLTILTVESMDCRLLNTGVTLTKKIRENIVNYTRTHQPLFQTSLDEPLGKDTIIVNSSKTDFKVPNIVHYIWYAQKPLPLRFDKVLSVLSAVKHLKPEAIYFHTNMEPVGKYYQMLKNISIFQVVKREPPKSIIKAHYETDYSNYDKVKIIMEKGGIYLDLDVMVTQSFDELRRHDCTVGYESDNKICSGVIVCVQNHAFLYLWLSSYYDDYSKRWSYNSGIVPSRIIERFPELVHTSKDKIHRPSFRELDKIWGKTPYPWKKNYTIHTWIRVAIKKNLVNYPTPESIKTMNSTYGQIARDVYYGSPDIIST